VVCASAASAPTLQNDANTRCKAKAEIGPRCEVECEGQVKDNMHSEIVPEEMEKGRDSNPQPTA